MKITVAHEGLYVVPILIFRLFHPPILLPWACVRNVGEGRVMGRTTLELSCEADGNVLKLYLPAGAASMVSAQCPAV